MPKILINEKDETLPGTPGSYKNYSVLIAGFTGRTPVLTADATAATEADEIQPDSNGVYEFTNADDFRKTIGLVSPEIKYSYKSGAPISDKNVEKADTSGTGTGTTGDAGTGNGTGSGTGTGTGDADTDTILLKHYGNQMAYELLRQGCPIIYLPLSHTDGISALKEADTWEKFRDKASYDFRFITHGLLSTNDDSLKVLTDRIKELNTATSELATIGLTFNTTTCTFTPTKDFEESKYASLKTAIENGAKDIPALKYYDKIDKKDKVYATSSEAAAAIGYEYSEKTALQNKVQISVDTINTVNEQIANLAAYVYKDDEDNSDIPGRGDCVALLEVAEEEYTATGKKPETAIIEAISKMSSITALNGKYCAVTVPSVEYKMGENTEFSGNNKFPGAFHYLACFLRSIQTGFAEWYAAAGYTRGVSNYVVDRTTVTLGEIAINALEPRNQKEANTPKFACNVIANFRGSYYLWGNRTAHPLGTKESGANLVASHFLNIRHLCTTIKKQLYVSCRRFTFDPNSDTLWFNFVNAIKPTLEAMKADQGIRDYRIVKVYTDKKATLKARIRIIPIEAVEDFDIEVRLEDSFGETVVTTD